FDVDTTNKRAQRAGYKHKPGRSFADDGPGYSDHEKRRDTQFGERQSRGLRHGHKRQQCGCGQHNPDLSIRCQRRGRGFHGNALAGEPTGTEGPASWKAKTAKNGAGTVSTVGRGRNAFVVTLKVILASAIIICGGFGGNHSGHAANLGESRLLEEVP